MRRLKSRFPVYCPLKAWYVDNTSRVRPPAPNYTTSPLSLPTPLNQTQPFSLFHLHTSRAVNPNDLAVDPLAILRSEESSHARDVDRHADAVCGRPGRGVLVDLLVGEVLAVGDVFLADLLVHVGLDAARRDRVHGDALVAGVCRIVLASRGGMGGGGGCGDDGDGGTYRWPCT